MRGRGSTNALSAQNKWSQINQMIRNKKIGVLALQETHLTDDLITQIELLYGKRMRVFSSVDPSHTNARGVAIVLNKEITAADDVQSWSLIPGRAILVRYKWHLTDYLTVCCIYAPNDTKSNENFWLELRQKWESDNIPRPDVLLGDFNIVEDAIDRMPAHTDEVNAVSALIELRTYLKLYDGWRTINPHARKFSYLQKSTGSQSRIDRIYTSERAIETSEAWNIGESTNDTDNVTTSGWETEASGVNTDHLLVSAKIVHRKTPHIGPGRWTMPIFLTEDRQFMSEANRAGLALEEELKKINETGRSELINPQTLFKGFKDEIIAKARQRAKVAIPKIEKEIGNLKKDLNSILNKHDAEAKDQQNEAAILQERICALEAKRYSNIRNATATKYNALGESFATTYWSNICKPRSPRNIIYNLAKPQNLGETSEYETRSQKMAELARDYHDNLQRNAIPDPIEKRAATDKVLRNIDKIVSERDKARMAEDVEPCHVEEALKLSQNGKATGINGIPYEFWKALHEWDPSQGSSEGWRNERRKKAKRNGRPNGQRQRRTDPDAKCEMMVSLAMIYNDIMHHGVARGTEFSVGWMYPLYKKGDKRNIANYRPITLLNSDYKIFTKIMALRLAIAAPRILHENQAGFVPNRSITDQVRLIKHMIDLAEATEQNGTIIALDQEKAYDRIDHEYLYAAMRKFEIPENFIKTVRTLYDDANTVLFINGEKSSPYKVTRGVRQGDPMSCLLFNIAIEPLASTLRKSELQGYSIPGLADKVLVALFADDTTIFLSEYDSYEALHDILQTWCTAATAKFNHEKTNVIPIGSKEYRKDVVDTRTLQNGISPLEASIRIAKDKEPTRILGAWLGNDVEDADPWSRTIDKVSKSLDVWNNAGLTLMGRSIVVQCVVGGGTQYLTTVQGMPKYAEKALQRIIRNFIWDGKKAPPINMETLYRPVEEGGINLLDIKARNEAILLKWMATYANFSNTRAPWTFLGDILISDGISRKDENVQGTARQNIILQSWSVPKTKRRDGKRPLPEDLHLMLKTANKYDVSVHAVKVERHLKEAMPLWFHIGADKEKKKINNLPGCKCLRDNHEVKTVGEAIRVTARLRLLTHQDKASCPCPPCTSDRDIRECRNPARCAKTAKKVISKLQPKFNPLERQRNDNLSFTPHRKDRNKKKKGRKEKESDAPSRVFQGERGRMEGAHFNPSMTTRGDLSAIVRVFVDPLINKPLPAHRISNSLSVERETTTVYTDGSCINNGNLNAKAGSGIWFGTNDRRNKAIRLPPNVTQSNQAGEIVAILVAAQIVPPFAPLTVISDSKYAIEGLTKHLHDWEDDGWIGIANAELFKATAARLRMRTAPTTFKWVKGHDGDEGNEGADELAGQGARKDTPDMIDLSIPDRFNLSGAKLATMTQKLAYQGIRLRTPTLDRPKTTQMLDLTRESVQRISAKLPTNAAIWKGVRHTDIPRKIQDFLWKGLHNAIKVGKYWKHIPSMEDRQLCPICKCEESMDHIVSVCNAPERATIWSLAESAWAHTNLPWNNPDIGTVLGAACVDFGEGDNTRSGENRLFRILITESAYLIWKIRCERRIRNGDPDRAGQAHSINEIKNRWCEAISRRINIDREQTNTRKYGRKAIKFSTVENTWKKILKDADNMPEHWFRRPGLLVSMDISSWRPPALNEVESHTTHEE